MAKTYMVPEFSERLLGMISELKLKVVRNSKTCVKLIPIDVRDSHRRRYYTFHINFDLCSIDSTNINEDTSTYRRATIWIKPEELELILAVQDELKKLLKSGKLLP